MHDDDMPLNNFTVAMLEFQTQPYVIYYMRLRDAHYNVDLLMNGPILGLN